MKKALAFALILVLALNSIFAAWTPLLSEDDAVQLLNYVQLSVSKVINARNKGMLEEEFSSVINNINPEALQDTNIIRGYEQLLGTLTRLKLSEMEKEHIIEVQEQQRKAAIFNTFNSFGSILTGTSPVQIAMVVVNAGLNYAKAVNDAKNTASEAQYQLERLDLETIDRQRADLYTTSAKVFQGRSNSTVGLIEEESMRGFASLANDIDVGDESTALKSIPALKQMVWKFESFAPFWVTYGDAYFKTGDYEKAMECYGTFERLMEDDHIFKNNSYYVRVAKNVIVILMSRESVDYERIERYVGIIRENTPTPKEKLDDMYYYLAGVYAYCGNSVKAQESIDYLIERGLEKSAGEGLFSTYVYSHVEGNAGKNSYLLASVWDNVAFGFDKINEKFIDDHDIKVGLSVFLRTPYKLVSAEYTTAKGKTVKEVFHAYSFEDEYLYCLDDLWWNEVLRDDTTLKLGYEVDGNRIDIIYSFSSKNESGSEFIKEANTDAFFFRNPGKAVFGGYVKAYVSLI